MPIAEVEIDLIARRLRLSELQNGEATPQKDQSPSHHRHPLTSRFPLQARGKLRHRPTS
jgi:hypothetical protein